MTKIIPLYTGDLPVRLDLTQALKDSIVLERLKKKNRRDSLRIGNRGRRIMDLKRKYNA